MNISDRFASLGAPLKNVGWSWGAVRQEDRTVFLRVWQDQTRRHENTRYASIASIATRRRDKPGRAERMEHVELIRKGAPCYLIMCRAVNPEARPRRIESFNGAELVRGGRPEEIEGAFYIEMLASVPVNEVELA